MIDYKKSTAPTNTVTRDVMTLCDETDNIYESVAIIGKRANQISADIKSELSQKLQEFASKTDSLEETFENLEQIEISTFYEKMPKPTLIATEEFIEEKATAILSEEAVEILVDCGEGNCSGTAWGCDLTYDYVKINADYRS